MGEGVEEMINSGLIYAIIVVVVYSYFNKFNCSSEVRIIQS